MKLEVFFKLSIFLSILVATKINGKNSGIFAWQFWDELSVDLSWDSLEISEQVEVLPLGTA
jgi:hypothetical protein